MQQPPEVTYSTSAPGSYTTDSKSSVRLWHSLAPVSPTMPASSASEQVRPVPTWVAASKSAARSRSLYAPVEELISQTLSALSSATHIDVSLAT